MLRAVDANLNRACEGLRVLEDLARFALDDGGLTSELKSLRHRLAATSIPIARGLLNARRAGEDVGAETPEAGRRDLLALLNANARRVQESLRALEELAKLPDAAPSLQPPEFKRARFQAYSWQCTLADLLLRKEKRERVRGLYAIVDPECCGDRSAVEVAEAALRGGAHLVQLRDKRRDKGLVLPDASALFRLCESHGALFIVNDDVDLALVSGADGVHLGQSDLPAALARRLMPLGAVVGVSVNNAQEARTAEQDGADYVAVGAIFPTDTKANTRPSGPNSVRQVREAVALPVVAIGGIKVENAASVVAAGADAVSVISALCGAEDVEAAARALVAAMEA